MPSISSLKEIKKGIVLIYKDKPHQILEANFLRMQQSQPVMQTRLRNLISGSVIKNNFKDSDKPEIGNLARHAANFLYQDGDNYIFMDSSTYEQFPLHKEVLQEKINFLTENLEVSLLFWNDQLITIDLPPKINCEITDTEPGARGNTAQGSVTKPATLETGFIIQVPIFVKTGDTIRVNTETGEYASRVNV